MTQENEQGSVSAKVQTHIFVTLRIGKDDTRIFRVSSYGTDRIFKGKIVLINPMQVSEGEIEPVTVLGGIRMKIRSWSVDEADVMNIVYAEVE